MRLPNILLPLFLVFITLWKDKVNDTKSMAEKKRRLKMPMVGMGTWELKGKECTDIVSLALDLGYRHIDTAHAYGNHKAIGKAIASVDREELFLTSKLRLEEVNAARIDASVRKLCDTALKELDTDYLDLYLIHWPQPNIPMVKVYKAMEKLIEQGKILHAGVSNFTVHHLDDFRKAHCYPVANQVEFHPFLNQKELLKNCHAQGIQLIAYRPLGKKKLLREDVFKEMAKKKGKSASQIILRWLVQKDIPVIAKASSKKHLSENRAVFDFVLTKEEMKRLDG
jgi:2,5-diketo-D-gluconate reductase B